MTTPGTVAIRAWWRCSCGAPLHTDHATARTEVSDGASYAITCPVCTARYTIQHLRAAS